MEKLESKPSQPCLVQVNYPGAHNSDELKNKLFRVGGWLGGGLVGEAANKTNSALLRWGLAELGNDKKKYGKKTCPKILLVPKIFRWMNFR